MKRLGELSMFSVRGRNTYADDWDIHDPCERGQ